MKFYQIKTRFLSSSDLKTLEELNEFKKGIFQNFISHDIGKPNENKKEAVAKKSRDEHQQLLKDIKELKLSGSFSVAEQKEIALLEEKTIKLGGIEHINNSTLRKIADFLSVLGDKSDKTIMENPAFKDIINDLNKNLADGFYNGIANVKNNKKQNLDTGKGFN